MKNIFFTYNRTLHTYVERVISRLV